MPMISEFIASPLWSGITFLVGLLLGHWLQVGRDRRTELLRAQAPVRAWIARQVANPDRDLWPMPSPAEMDAYTSRLPWWVRTRFSRHWEAMCQSYSAAYRQDPDSGALEFLGTPPEGWQHMQALEKLTRP